MKKRFYIENIHFLSSEAKESKNYVLRICKLLTKISGKSFSVEMNSYNNTYEGYIIGNTFYNGEIEDGMVFWGGFFNRKKDKNALSRAWISLLEDCIGNSEGGKIAEFHNLTDSLKCFDVNVDLNCKTIENLENILKKNGV